MLGRKQSIKGEPILADYGPEESLNESADIEWVNKVNENLPFFKISRRNIYFSEKSIIIGSLLVGACARKTF